jgi:hypothetical protein
MSIQFLLKSMIDAHADMLPITWLAFRALVGSADEVPNAETKSEPPVCHDALRPAFLAIVTAYAGAHPGDWQLLARFAAGITRLCATSPGDSDLVDIFKLGQVVRPENESLCERALDIVSDFASDQLVEAALKYLNKFDRGSQLLTIDHRIWLVEKLLTAGATNVLINAAMPCIKFDAAAIIRNPRIREIFTTTRPKSMREKVLRMQLKFFSEGGRFELTDADLIRLVTDQKDTAMTLDPVLSPGGLSGSEMGGPDDQALMSYFDDVEIVNDDSIWTDDSENSGSMVFMDFK